MFSECYHSDESVDDGKGKETEAGLKPARMTRNWSGSALLSIAILLSAASIILLLRSLLSSFSSRDTNTLFVKILLLAVELCQVVILGVTVIRVNAWSGRSSTLVFLPLPVGAFLESCFAEHIVPVQTIASVAVIIAAVFYKLLCYAALVSQSTDRLTALFKPFHKTYKRNGLLIKLRDFA